MPSRVNINARRRKCIPGLDAVVETDSLRVQAKACGQSAYYQRARTTGVCCVSSVQRANAHLLRQDYFRPGSALFRDFIDTELISRYQLSSLVTQATVTSVTYGPIHVQGEDTVEGMRVVSRMPDGSIETIGAKAVVFAVGPSSKPNIPAVISQALPRHLFDEDPALPWRRDSLQGEAWCHSAAFALEGFKFLSERIQRKVRAGKPTTVVVIGGG